MHLNRLFNRRVNIKVNDLNTRYWAAGSGRPVVILIHVGCAVESWELNIHELAKNNRVYALDLSE